MPKQVQRQDASPACSWSAEWLPQIYCYTVIVRWAEKQWVCVRLQVGRLWLTQTLTHTTQSSTNWFWVGPIDHRF